MVSNMTMAPMPSWCFKEFIVCNKDTVFVTRVNHYYFEPDDVGVDFMTDILRVTLSCGCEAYVENWNDLRYCPYCGSQVVKE